MKSKLVILCGIPFSGKTTLAKALVDLKSYKHIDLDDVKNKLFGDEVTDEEITESQ